MWGLRSLAAIAGLVLVSGCVVDDGSSEADLTDAALSAADTARVLDLVNYPKTDQALLDATVGLDKRAAKNIVVHRNGADGMSPSSDDDAFDDAKELAAISYVGSSALKKLAAYAAAHPAPAAETVETVKFLGWESEATVWGVNHATSADLTALGLTSTQASSVVASAPYTTVKQIGAVKNIGAATLRKLHAAALGTWGSMQTSCAISFGASPAPAIDDYAAKLEAFDPRSVQYHYKLGAASVPTCIDPASPAALAPLREELIAFSGWQDRVAQFPEVFQYGAVTAGPTLFRTFLDTSLSHMSEQKDQLVANGDPSAQAEFDALSMAFGPAAALTDAHPGGTFSMQIRLEASECSEKSIMFVDPAAGLVIMLVQPAQC